MRKPDRHLKERGDRVDASELHEFKIKSNGNYAREQVFERDRGVCKSCKLDTEALRSLLYRVKAEKGGAAYQGLLRYYEQKTGYSFELGTHAWEADHCLSVADGGGSCGLENLITLCVPCHRAKTKAWFRNRNKRRRRKKR
jgi:5-methylcytosine-specific restriction endonuclease McrA